VIFMGGIDSMSVAVLAMALVGICGGVFVVPLNALLQKRGHESVGAGSALAVQNFFENLTMFVFVSGYSLVRDAGVGVTRSVAGFGVVLVVVLGALSIVRLRRTAAGA
jgi:LPLT family lysophospholipid transporter-like MFS transporter